MEDHRVGDEKLLVAKNDKRHGKICRRLWFVSKDEESDRGTNRKVDDE